MKKTLLLLLFVGMAALGACSDDDNSTNPTTDGKIFPTTAGSYWFYNNYDVDSTNQEIYNGEVDSTVCLGTENYLGKTAIALMHYYFKDNEPNGSDKSYIAEENSKVYVLSEDVSGDTPLGDGSSIIGTRWLKVYDANEDSWMIFDTTLTAASFGDQTSFTGGFTMTGKKSTDKSFLINGKSINANQAIMKVVISGNVSTGGYALPISLTFTTHLYFAKGIGLIATVTDPTTIPVFGTNPGTALRLQRYQIK